MMYSPVNYHRRRWNSSSKDRERNILASILSIVVTVLLCTSLAEPKWFYLKGGGGSCQRKYLGAYEFFYIGYFDNRYDDQIQPSSSSSSERDGPTGFVYHGYDETITNCITPQIVTLFRVVIAFVFLAIVSSLFAFSLDTFGVSHKTLKILKRNAVGSILTVVFSVNVVGLCYYLSTLLAHELELSKLNRGTRVEVKFEVSFFLVTAAGAVAVLASAANLLKRYPPTDDVRDDALLDDLDGVETFSVNCLGSSGSGSERIQYPTPPPPYTP